MYIRGCKLSITSITSHDKMDRQQPSIEDENIDVSSEYPALLCESTRRKVPGVHTPLWKTQGVDPRFASYQHGEMRSPTSCDTDGESRRHDTRNTSPQHQEPDQLPSYQATSRLARNSLRRWSRAWTDSSGSSPTIVGDDDRLSSTGEQDSASSPPDSDSCSLWSPSSPVPDTKWEGGTLIDELLHEFTVTADERAFLMAQFHHADGLEDMEEDDPQTSRPNKRHCSNATNQDSNRQEVDFEEWIWTSYDSIFCHTGGLHDWTPENSWTAHEYQLRCTQPLHAGNMEDQADVTPCVPIPRTSTVGE